jgi:uridine kinase
MSTVISGRKYGKSVTLGEIAKEVQGDGVPFAAGKLDGILRDLQTPVGGYHTIELIRLDEPSGRRIYRRSAIFLLVIAVHELYPKAGVVVQFSANNGLYCDINLPAGRKLDAVLVKAIEDRMRSIVAEQRPVLKKSLPREEAVKLFKQSKQIEKVNLIAALQQPMVSMYYCGDFYDYLYGPMLGNTGDIGAFALDFYAPGILLRTPEQGSVTAVPDSVAQPKLSNILGEAKDWAKILHCDYVTDLNRYNRQGDIGEIIHISEALQEKKIVEIADHIAKHRDQLRLVLIAGPSSSGKTSFAQRLRIQLRVNGLEPASISLDDYFCNREDTPRNEKGEYDFEALEALDLKLFNDNMVNLLKGEEVTIPTYNFVTGEREWNKAPMTLAAGEPVIIEGIHGLNEKLSVAIPRKNKYKIYISALTQLNIDSHNRIPTTDARLIRRLVRDYQFRGSSALKTLRQWPDVRAGEEKNIFPFQEEADTMFNSALIYELGVLKQYVVPMLAKVPRDVPEYTKARRLLDFCEYFDDIKDEDDIPNNSLLREFIGRSCFFK